MLRQLPRAVVCAGLVLATVQTASAQTSFTETYGFTGQPGTEASVTATGTPPTGLTFNPLTRFGSFVTGTARTNSIATSVIAPNIGFGGANEGAFQFGLTAAAGSTITVTSATLLYGSTGNTNNAFTVVIRSSTDGFTTSTSLGTQTFFPPTTNLANTITVTGTSTTGKLDFRLYVSNSNNSASTFALDTNAIVNGTFTPVPEPASVLALGVGGLGLFAGVRRRFR